MSEITLREVCDTLGVSRRAIQGYEKAGLVSPTGKNIRGYLLYDESSQERIKKIKLFQEMGFSIKEICEIIDAPTHILKSALEKRIEKIKEDCEQKYEMIHIANELIAKL